MIKNKLTNIVCKRAFDGFDGLQLPHSPRTYLDSLADEFNDIDLNKKLYHFGFLVIRDIDFYHALRENIDEKMADPRYHDYENTARYAFANYLEALCGYKSNDHQQSFEALYYKLVDELKARYYEYDDFDTNKRYYGFK